MGQHLSSAGMKKFTTDHHSCFNAIDNHKDQHIF